MSVVIRGKSGKGIDVKLEFREGINMPDGVIVCFSELDETKKQEAVEVFLDGFGHMFTFAKTRAEQEQLFQGHSKNRWRMHM